MLKLLEDATGSFDTAKMAVDESVLPSPDKYDDILKKYIAEGKLTGIPVSDARIADDAGLSRMAQPMEKDMLLKAKLNPKGSRMVTPAELEKLAARKSILQKMTRPLASKGLSRAAGLALGPLGLLASEAADASELGPAKGSRDEIIESARPAEEKAALLRGLDTMEKTRRPDYMEDVNVMRRKVEDLIESQDTRSMEEKERDAEANLRKQQILRGLRSR